MLLEKNIFIVKFLNPWRSFPVLNVIDTFLAIVILVSPCFNPDFPPQTAAVAP